MYFVVLKSVLLHKPINKGQMVRHRYFKAWIRKSNHGSQWKLSAWNLDLMEWWVRCWNLSMQFATELQKICTPLSLQNATASAPKTKWLSNDRDHVRQDLYKKKDFLSKWYLFHLYSPEWFNRLHIEVWLDFQMFLKKLKYCQLSLMTSLSHFAFKFPNYLFLFSLLQINLNIVFLCSFKQWKGMSLQLS